MSKLTPDLMWPMCGGAWTVAPHRYSVALPGVSGTKSRVLRVAVSWRRSVTLHRLRDSGQFQSGQS